jgi:OmpA-OmpF porin, OOP family
MGIRGTVFRMSILAIMTFFATAGAEIKVRSIDVTPFMGVYFFQDNLYVNLDDRAHFGGRLGYNITENWGVEATGGHVDTETSVDYTTNSGRFIPRNTDTDFWTFHLDAIYNFFPEDQVNPYLALGAGGYNIDIQHMDSNIDPLMNYGFGIKYFLTEWVAFRIDARHILAVNEIDNFEEFRKRSSQQSYF